MGVPWLAGIFPPIATAFAPDGALRPPAAGFLEFLKDGGLDGVVALGSNGEAAHLTEAERLQWIGWVREALPAPLRLIVGTGAESTRATIERTRAAAEVGAEAALVIAPSYFRRQLTAEALRAHYHSVAQASPIPILIYNVPGHMGYDLGAEWIVRMTGHANIVGLKDSSGDIGRLPGLRARLGPDFTLLAGAGENWWMPSRRGRTARSPRSPTLRRTPPRAFAKPGPSDALTRRASCSAPSHRSVRP